MSRVGMSGNTKERKNRKKEKTCTASLHLGLHLSRYGLSRLTLTRTCQSRCYHTQGTALCFMFTHGLNALPAKPKAKIDPQKLLMMEKRKKARLEKELKRLQKIARHLKPIEEIEGTPKLRREAKSGIRERESPPLSVEELEEEILTQKEWTRQRIKLHLEERRMMNRIVRAQEKALEKLREESEELYQQAIETDERLIPYSFTGPTVTPPIKDFDPVDGEYVDVTNYFNKPPKPL